MDFLTLALFIPGLIVGLIAGYRLGYCQATIAHRDGFSPPDAGDFDERS